jgi:Cytochrome oxidase complex assembly protein 1
MEVPLNTSGQGKNAIVPAEVNRWNWGAFFLSWIWGICNNTYIAFLVFIPFANLVMMFILGAKGSAWAWQNKRWDSIEQFRAVQRKWAVWGVVVIIGIITLLVSMFFLITGIMKKSAPYQAAIQQIESSSPVAEFIGKPFSTGMVSGQISTSSEDGNARLSFSISGPKGEGRIYLQATQSLGQWQMDQLILVTDQTHERIELIQPPEESPR